MATPLYSMTSISQKSRTCDRLEKAPDSNPGLVTGPFYPDMRMPIPENGL